MLSFAQCAAVATRPSTAVFWSGGLDVALRLARDRNQRRRLFEPAKQTLEDTPGGQILEALQPQLVRLLDWKTEIRPAWAALSRRFAEQASGIVDVVLAGDGPRYSQVPYDETSIFFTEELDRLSGMFRSNPAIKFVRYFRVESDQNGSRLVEQPALIQIGGLSGNS